jgi:HSP20 family protein
MATQNLARYSGPRAAMPLSDAMNQLFRDAFTSPFMAGGTAMQAGAGINLYERDDSYILQIPLPGVKPDDLKVTARENVVMFQGTIEIPAPEGARPLFQGAGGGQFREQVVLPSDVDAEKAQADYQDGVLTLTLPKAQHARERTIAVSVHDGHNQRSQQSSSGQQTGQQTGQQAASGQRTS